MEEITGITVIQEESGRTTEEFIYQNEKYYFKGYLTKFSNGTKINLRGGAFEFEENNKRTIIGTIIVNFIVHGGHPSINIINNKSIDFTKTLSLIHNILSILK